MSRFNPYHTNTNSSLVAVEKWRDDSLLNGMSIFLGDRIWTNESLADLKLHFTDNPDFTKRNFYIKLEGQLKAAPTTSRQLMAEILWVLQIFPSTIKSETKRSDIINTWSWSGVQLDASHPMLTDEVLGGLGSPGPAFLMHRPLELRFAISAFAKLVALPKIQRIALLKDPWAFAEWLELVYDEGDRQLKHILPYLLFPDEFERISSSANFRQILTRIGNLPEKMVKKMSKVEMDREILGLRARLEQINTGPIDFYDVKFKKLWSNVRQPNWIRDELILALELYMSNRQAPPSTTSPQVIEMSELLRNLASLNGQSIDHRFRNTNGVHLKMMNFRALDPQYTSLGKVGMRSGGALDEQVWEEFSGDTKALNDAALEIREIVSNPILSTILQARDEISDNAEEGGVQYRVHRSYERSAKIIAKKKASVGGNPKCEVCSFSFSQNYGEHGLGYIEVHHLKPVHTIRGKHKTSLEDLAVLCANCHRMMHRRKSLVMTVEQLREMMKASSN